jgi:uncharacterized spore protein YtfJ
MEVERLLGKAADHLSVGRSFGPPIERDGVLIIPVAWVAGGGGGGAGGTQHDESGEPDSGGGFGGVTWPLGVYVVRDGNVRWVPAIDATRIALAALALFRTFAKLRALRRTSS